METQFQTEEDQIHTLQTNVDYLRTTLNIVDSDPNSLSPTPTLTQEWLQQYNTQQIEEEKNYKMLQTQLTELQAYSTDKLRQILPTVTGDAELSGLLDKLNEAEQKFVVLTNDYNPNNNFDRYPRPIRD